MTEQELDRHLENIIIDGLIKEGEQDSADFAEAMRRMSDEDFRRMLGVPERPVAGGIGLERASRVAVEPVAPRASVWKRVRPWAVSGVAAAAVVVAVLVPTLHSVDGRLCESALAVSRAYVTPSRGMTDLAVIETGYLRQQLPVLEHRYAEACREAGAGGRSEEIRVAGWDLVTVYLRLHRKGDAVRLLGELSERYPDTPFGAHCRDLLDLLK